MDFLEWLISASDLFGYESKYHNNTMTYTFKIPGTEREHIEVYIEDNILVLKITEGIYKGDHKLRLRKGYDIVEAKYKNGIITVNVKYAEPVKTNITIE